MRLLLTLVAALLYAVGWCAGLVSLLAVWCWSALAVGWDEARSLRRAREPAGSP